MNQETDTPQTNEIETAYEQQRESVGGIIEHARQLERELNEAIATLRNLTDEISRHESASMMHPRLTRAITAATKLTTETT